MRQHSLGGRLAAPRIVYERVGVHPLISALPGARLASAIGALVCLAVLAGLPVDGAVVSTQAGQVGGASYALAVDGGAVYLGVGPRMLTVDIAEPGAPAFVGSSGVLPALVRGIAVADGYAYVLASQRDLGPGPGRKGSLRVFDVGEPSTPTEVATLELDGALTAVWAEEDHVYVTSTAMGLVIVDVRVPSGARVEGAVPVGSSPVDVEARGEFVYVAERYRGLLIVDASDKTSPEVIREVRVPDDQLTEAVSVTTGYGYLVTSDRHSALASIQVVDLAVPAAATLTESRALEWFADDLEAGGGHLYVVGDGTLETFKIGAGGLPISLGELVWPGRFGEVRIQDGLALMAAEVSLWVSGQNTAGLRVVDVADPAHPLVKSALTTLSGARTIGASESQTVVAAHCRDPLVGSVLVLDDLDPEREYACTSDVTGVAWDIHVMDGHALLTMWDGDVPSGGLRVVRTEDPDGAALVAGIEFDYGAQGLEVAGTRAYLAIWDGLAIVELSDLRRPRVMGTVRTGSAGESRLTVGGSHVYIVQTEGGVGNETHHLVVIDAADISNPREVARTELPAWPYDVAHWRGMVYVADGAGLSIFDAADPTRPRLRRTVRHDGRGHRLVVARGYLYLATWSSYQGSTGHIYAYSLTRPGDPALVAEYSLPSAPRDIAASGAAIHVAADEAGIYELPLYDGVRPWETTTPRPTATATSTQRPSPTTATARATPTPGAGIYVPVAGNEALLASW